jgi:hypothetical protein
MLVFGELHRFCPHSGEKHRISLNFTASAGVGAAVGLGAGGGAS